MELKEYMSLANMKDGDLARELKQATGLVRDRSTVSRWRRKETRPDWEAMKALTQITRGAVTASDFIEIVGRGKTNAAA